RLLPGVLMPNAGGKFVCRDVRLRVENTQTLFTGAYEAGQEIVVPVAHHDGNYFADDETLKRLEGEGRVAFRYVGGTNPNGSIRDIAGIYNETKTVLGLMPHPENHIDPLLGSIDGKPLFTGLVEALA
ncbi:MAG: phosphoribosylformylglycinamidine synthase subunit PurQ, partial [Alphaproteobacteria bacterium]|nr:phosphoribosylformylglycinamidine synthase subunit PurQ [Alphaproteobacteria bacterium]